MQTSAIECKHPEFTCDIVEHPWEDGSGVVADAAVRCTGCGMHLYNASDAREAGVFPQADAARRAALDAWHAKRDGAMLPCPFCCCTTLNVGVETGATRPRVVCGECGARGPLARSGENREAIANWNRRPGLRDA